MEEHPTYKPRRVNADAPQPVASPNVFRLPADKPNPWAKGKLNPLIENVLIHTCLKSGPNAFPLLVNKDTGELVEIVSLDVPKDLGKGSVRISRAVPKCVYCDQTAEDIAVRNYIRGHIPTDEQLEHMGWIKKEA